MRAARLSTTAPARSPAPRPSPRSPAPRPPPASAPRARRLRIGDLDGDSPTVELTAIELRDRVVRAFCRVHLDEPEPTRLTREPVGNHRRRQDVAALAEEFPQSLAGGGVGEAADIELGRHRNPRSLPLIAHAPRLGRVVTSEARSGHRIGRTA